MILLKIIFKLNSTVIKFILKILYGNKIKMGKSLNFRKRFDVLIDKSGKLIIGDYCFFNNDCSINCLGNIRIGDNCLFGENIKMYDHNHIFNDINKNIKDQGYKIELIKIGKNCWIGSNVTILSNVIIGDNVVIGANCLIYKSIPSNSIIRSQNNFILTNR